MIPNGQLPNLKLTSRRKLDRRKTCSTALFTTFKLAKNTGFELEQQRQRNAFLPKISQRQRNHAREIARKLETVNDELKAETSHLVPPERT